MPKGRHHRRPAGEITQTLLETDFTLSAEKQTPLLSVGVHGVVILTWGRILCLPMNRIDVLCRQDSWSLWKLACHSSPADQGFCLPHIP